MAGLTLLRMVSLSFLFLVVSVAGAGAAAVPGTVGYDISYPNCSAPFPAGGAFGIVGVNGGLSFSPNACLPTELAWAGTTAQLYANTADPGPLLSSRWSNGQTAPKPCNTPDSPGADTLECHYDYGWNAAADSYATAVAAYVSLGQAGAGATATPTPLVWWLDVEAANSWTVDPARNVAALQGEVDYLRSVGAAQVGLYAAPSAWASITGGTLVLSGLPAWVPGAASLQDAQSRCAGTAFNGGPIQLVQFPLWGFDGDYACPTAPASVSLTGVPRVLVAGMPSRPLAVTASTAAAAALGVTLASTSASGRFSASASGPWSRTLVASIGQGLTASGAFFYRDTRAGKATLRASGAGIAPVTQAVLVTAAQPARIVVSPGRATLRVGQRRIFSARLTDAYDNRVMSLPTWSVTAGRVVSVASRARGATVRVRALAPGRAVLRAHAGQASGSAVLVVRR